MTMNTTTKTDTTAQMVARDGLEEAAGMSFDGALARFVAEVSAMQVAHSAEKKLGFVTVLTVEMGKRYARVWRKYDTDHDSGRGSAYFFVDTLTGDILKPATWKGPAKGARGNIFLANRKDAVGVHGAAYLR